MQNWLCLRDGTNLFLLICNGIDLRDLQCLELPQTIFATLCPLPIDNVFYLGLIIMVIPGDDGGVQRQMTKKVTKTPRNNQMKYIFDDSRWQSTSCP